jgi:hypothetical protein
MSAVVTARQSRFRCHAGVGANIHSGQRKYARIERRRPMDKCPKCGTDLVKVNADLFYYRICCPKKGCGYVVEPAYHLREDRPKRK